MLRQSLLTTKKEGHGQRNQNVSLDLYCTLHLTLTRIIVIVNRFEIKSNFCGAHPRPTSKRSASNRPQYAAQSVGVSPSSSGWLQSRLVVSLSRSRYPSRAARWKCSLSMLGIGYSRSAAWATQTSRHCNDNVEFTVKRPIGMGTLRSKATSVTMSFELKWIFCFAVRVPKQIDETNERSITSEEHEGGRQHEQDGPLLVWKLTFGAFNVV